MPAYIVVDMKITDADAVADYDSEVSLVVARHGGRFIVRGGAVEILEGNWRPSRVIILEFPDMEAIRAFYGSAEYAPLLARRLLSASADVIMVDGVDRAEI